MRQMNRIPGHFKSYIISYVGVVLFTLALLSTAAAWYVAEKTKAEEIRVTEGKLYTIVEDLENQLDGMRWTVLEIASQQEFRQDYFQQNKYYEVELLNQLGKYKRFSPLSDFFFLKYKGSNTIFTSDETTFPLESYFTGRYKDANYDDAIELIDRMCLEMREPLNIYRDADYAATLFIYPMKKYAVSGIGREGAVCFEVSEKRLIDRMETIAGKLDGDIRLYYDDILIYGEEMETVGDELVLTTGTGGFNVVYRPGDQFFSWSNVLSIKEGIVLGCIFLVLLCVAILAAYKSYQPIRKIAEKYRRVTDVDLTEDFGGIDLLIGTLLLKEEKNSRLLQEQYQALREQTLRLIASGGYAPKLQERLLLFNIHLDMPVYGRILCYFSDSEAFEECYEHMYQDVEDLSDDGIRLYSFWDDNEDHALTVLVAVEEVYQMDEVTESLQSLFEAKNLTVKVKTARICHDLKHINQDMPPEQNSMGEMPPLPGGTGTENKKMISQSKKTADQAVAYIEKNCTEYDLSLDMIAQELHVTPTYLCRLIKQQTGISYKEYLTELRIAKAKAMLAEKSVSVADVCQRIGYTNVSYFIKVFQKHTGVTPAKYRDEN